MLVYGYLKFLDEKTVFPTRAPGVKNAAQNATGTTPDREISTPETTPEVTPRGKGGSALLVQGGPLPVIMGI